jgi:hypothetical protein
MFLWVLWVLWGLPHHYCLADPWGLWGLAFLWGLVPLSGQLGLSGLLRQNEQYFHTTQLFQQKVLQPTRPLCLFRKDRL